MNALKVAMVKEVAELLGEYGWLRCRPGVEKLDDGTVRLTVDLSTNQPDTEIGEIARAYSSEALETLGLFHDLQHLEALCQVRALGARYGLDMTAIEQALLRRKEGA